MFTLSKASAGLGYSSADSDCPACTTRLVQSPALHKQGKGAYACHPSTWEVAEK